MVEFHSEFLIMLGLDFHMHTLLYEIFSFTRNLLTNRFELLAV